VALVVLSGKRSEFANASNLVVQKGGTSHIIDGGRHRRFDQNSFAVRELLKAFVSTVTAVTTLTNSAETLVVANNLKYALVCYEGTRRSFGRKSMAVVCVRITKVINCKRLGLRADDLDGLTDCAKWNDWHNRAEDFFLHEGRITFRLQNYCWLDMLGFFNRLAAEEQLTTRRVNQFLHTI